MAGPRTEAEQRLYVEGQVSALRIICADMLREIDPKGDLKDRVRNRVALRFQGMQANQPPGFPDPLIDGTLRVLDSFVELLDLERY